MTPRRLLATAVLTAISATSCNESNNSGSPSNHNTTASRYYLAPEVAGNGASVNGIDVSTGKMTYDENDIDISQLELSRQYSSQGAAPTELGGWQHNYGSSLDAGGIPAEAWQGSKSPEYPDAATACESGWQDISSSAYNGQLQAAEAVFNAGLCELKMGGTTVARLPVQGSDGNSSHPIHILTRADGSRITFYQQQDGVWATTTSEPYQLESSAAGWDVTTPNGSVETYAADGKLVSTTNPQGQTTTLDYNVAGQLEKVTSPFGQTLTLSYTGGKLAQASSAAGTTTYTYGADGKLSQVTLADGSTHSYTYTADGKLDSITDATGAVVARYTYDSAGRVTHSEGAAGTQARSFSYNGAETSVTDVANNATDTYAHAIIQGLARATRSTDSAGATETTEYNANGYPIKTVDKNGLVTLTTWNARGLPESTTTAAGTAQARTILTEWHPQFRKPSKVIEPGKVTLYGYDADGKLTSTTAGIPAAASRPAARAANSQMQAMRGISSRAALKSAGYDVQESTIAYNGDGQPTETIAPNGAVTTYTYDSNGNQTSTTNALNHTSKTLEFDAAGRALKAEDENGTVTANTYDAAGRLSTATANGQTTRYEYDAAGRQAKVTYPDGSYSQTAYDAAGNTASTTDAQGNSTTYTYDSNGNQLTETVTDPQGNARQTSRRDYNAQNQLEKSTDADGNTTTYGYDKAGNQTSVTDAQGRVTTHEYDAQNRLAKTTDPAGGVTQYTYDLNGNRSTVIAPNGAATSYAYDGFNRLMGETSPDRGGTANTYDTSGNLKTSTDANGNTATHDYDLLNRKVKTTWQDGSTASYVYDTCANGIGRLCTLTDSSSGSTTYSYDTEGRITQKTQTIGNATLSHSYAYTADGKLQGETLPSGATVGYTYTQDKLTGVSLNGQAYMSNIRYNAAGSVTGWQWADGTTYTKTYDANGRLKTFPLGNALRTLSYDTVGNITGWDDNSDAAKTKHFSYDLLDRLDGYTAANEAQAFQYDPNGNRTLKTDNGSTTVYGIQINSNRLTQIGNTAQAQDANGNLLNDGTHSYTYNAQNRLASVDGTTAYTYNADNQRVRKTTPKGTTLYAWDNDRIIGEYATVNGAAQQATETVYFGNTPVALIQNGNTYRIYADQIDTPRVITDTSGKTVWAWDSKPFGETLPDEDPDKDGLGLHYSQRFPGQSYDAETGLHYNFHRDYNPQTGRYVQSDPIGLEGGLNTFGYVGGNSLARVDLHGQWWQTTPTVQYLTVSYNSSTRIVNINGRFRFYGNRNTSQLQTLFLNGMRNTWNRRVGIFDVRLNVSSDNASDRSIEITDNTRLSATDSTTAWVDGVGGKNMHLHHARSSGWTAAHEFGHFLRLGDQYVEGPVVNGQRTNRVRPGREGTLMASNNGRLAEIEVACTIDRSNNSNFKPEICGTWNGR